MTAVYVLYTGIFLVEIIIFAFCMWFMLSLINYLKIISHILDEQNEILDEQNKILIKTQLTKTNESEKTIHLKIKDKEKDEE